MAKAVEDPFRVSARPVSLLGSLWGLLEEWHESHMGIQNELGLKWACHHMGLKAGGWPVYPHPHLPLLL